jgi:hypothetical protein
MLITAVGVALPERAGAQAVTPDPGAWRPMAYADLQHPAPASATYADIWKDAVAHNNQIYLQRGDMRFKKANAPAVEAHFVVWSSRRSAVLSILDTATGCTVKMTVPQTHATVKLCPMRIAIYDGLDVRTLDGGRACFLERSAGTLANPTGTAGYASYDVARHTVRIGMIVDHKAVDGCSLSVPLDRQ